MQDENPPTYIECSDAYDEKDYMVLDKPNYEDIFKKLLDRLKNKWDRDASEIVAHYNDIEKGILTEMNREIEEIKNSYASTITENRNKMNIELRKYNSIKENQINEILHRTHRQPIVSVENISYLTHLVVLIKSIFQ